MKPKTARTAIRSLGVLLILSVFPGTAPGGETVALTINDAVRIAIERNLGLKVASFTPAIADTDTRKARSIYDPSLSAFAAHQESNLPAGPGSDQIDRRRFFDLDASISQLLPTGATTSLSFTNLFYRDNLELQSSRYARPELMLSFSQPLLKGAGREVTERGITSAEDAMDASLADWHRQALDTGADARNRYLELVKARENLATRQASLALAQQIHAENEGRVRAGVLASYQLQDSLLGVLRRRAELLEAERAVKDASDRFVTALNLPTGTVPAVSGIPGPAEPAPSEEAALQAALVRRPDIALARIDVRTAEFNEKVSRNLALPSLALEGNAGIAGFDSGYDDALDDLAGGKYPDWSVGLRFSMPIGNRLARADLAANRLKAARARARLSEIRETAWREVRTALRAVETRREQIDVTAQGVTVAETRLASYRKRHQLGLADTKDLLDVLAGLTEAREYHSAARADFQSAVTALWKATGELLDREGLRVEDIAPVPGTRKEER